MVTFLLDVKLLVLKTSEEKLHFNDSKDKNRNHQKEINGTMIM